MLIKKYIRYLIIFIASFILAPIAFKGLIKKANENAQMYTQHFNPVTSKLSDGIYVGKFKMLKIFTLSNIEFEIKNGVVKQLTIKKLFHSPGSPYKEEIENQINKTKKLEVNAISGATRTSNFAKAAIKSAINNDKT